MNEEEQKKTYENLLSVIRRLLIERNESIQVINFMRTHIFTSTRIVIIYSVAFCIMTFKIIITLIMQMFFIHLVLSLAFLEPASFRLLCWIYEL